MSIVKLAYFSEETHKGHTAHGAAAGAALAAGYGGYNLHKFRHVLKGYGTSKLQMAKALGIATAVGAGAGAGIGSLIRRKKENA